jgi:hypothetical protein
MDVQGVPLFHHQQYERAGCIPFHHQQYGRAMCTLSTNSSVNVQGVSQLSFMACSVDIQGAH